MELLNLKSVDLIRIPPKIDDILACGMCGRLSKVTLTGTKLVEPEELKELSEDELKDLDFAGRAIKKHLESN